MVHATVPRRGLRPALIVVLAVMALLLPVPAHAVPSAAPAGSRIVLLVSGVPRSTAAASSPATPPWANCGITDASSKLLKVYPNRVGGAAILPGQAQLLCGYAPSDDEGWGFRHISRGHGLQDEWGELAFLAGAPSWRDVADWAITETLAAPGSVSQLQSNDTVAYRAPLQFRDTEDGQVVAEYTVMVSVASVTKNIITAYPEGL